MRFRYIGFLWMINEDNCVWLFDLIAYHMFSVVYLVNLFPFITSFR